jgi:hypothetical protein
LLARIVEAELALNLPNGSAGVLGGFFHITLLREIYFYALTGTGGSVLPFILPKV